MVTRAIGMDLGVTSASEVAVADGARVEKVFRSPSTPEGLSRAIQRAAGGEAIELVLESTAMAWFVAGVVAEKSGMEHTLYRVSGRKAAALRDFYRFHTKTDRIDARVLAKMPLLDDALRVFELPSAGELALKRLVTLRAKLVHRLPAVLISNDSDLREPVRVLTRELGKEAVIAYPARRKKQRVSKYLAAYATSVRAVRVADARACQLPAELTDRFGTVTKPVEWQT